MRREIVLLIDQAGPHSSAAFTKFLDNKRMFYLFLPAGMTHVFQPLDVVINRPLKVELRKIYLSWLETIVLTSNVRRILPPKESQVLDWVFHAMKIITSELIFTSFTATGVLSNLKQLYYTNTLNERLQSMLCDYLHEDDLLQPEAYQDGAQVQLQRILNDWEILFEGEDE